MGGLGRGIPVLWILEDLLIQNITPKALKKKRAEGWLNNGIPRAERKFPKNEWGSNYRSDPWQGMDISWNHPRALTIFSVFS